MYEIQLEGLYCEGNGISFISGIYLVHGTVFAGVPMYLKLKTYGFPLEVPFNHGARAQRSNGQGIRPAVNVGLSVSRGSVATAGCAGAAKKREF